MPFKVIWSSVLRHLLTSTLKDGSYLDTGLRFFKQPNHHMFRPNILTHSYRVQGVLFTSIFDNASVKMQFFSLYTAVGEILLME